jgi:wyosine [tRNA(Phe)-imidazoG37] synthetase (radical SAM superfamily)
VFLWSQPVYGPVRSRRLGLSLGVNLLPTGRKVCTYDCPYCECGFTRDERKSPDDPHGPDTTLPLEGAVLAAVERALVDQAQSGEALDSITFAGNGEPTLHPRFENILETTRALRDRLAPQARIAVLTNGIRLREESVREVVLRADDPEVKLDAGTPATFERVAAPTVPWTLGDLSALLRDLDGSVSVQTCLFRGNVDNTTAADLDGMVEIIAAARPRRVLAYTLDRAPADSKLEAAPREVLDGFVARVKGVGVPAEVY